MRRGFCPRGVHHSESRLVAPESSTLPPSSGTLAPSPTFPGITPPCCSVLSPQLGCPLQTSLQALFGLPRSPILGRTQTLGWSASLSPISRGNCSQGAGGQLDFPAPHLACPALFPQHKPPLHSTRLLQFSHRAVIPGSPPPLFSTFALAGSSPAPMGPWSRAIALRIRNFHFQWPSPLCVAF